MDWTLNEFAREDVVKEVFSSDVALRIMPEEDDVEPEIILITEMNEGELFGKYGNYFVEEVKPYAMDKIDRDHDDDDFGFCSISIHLVMLIDISKENLREKFEREEVKDEYGYSDSEETNEQSRGY